MMCLDIYCDVRVTGPLIWRKYQNTMDLPCFLSTFQVGHFGVMIWGIFYLHILEALVLGKCRLNGIVYRLQSSMSLNI